MLSEKEEPEYTELGEESGFCFKCDEKAMKKSKQEVMKFDL